MAENATENAKAVYSFFRGKGWTPQAISGMLGNMQGESGLIADRDEVGGGGGYGLVQWTPKSNLVNWANSNGLNYRTVDTQCRRIQWELENGQQFYATGAYPLNFRQFSQSTQSPTYLAKVFINNYERPANPNQPQRGVWAESWYGILNGSGTIPNPTNPNLNTAGQIKGGKYMKLDILNQTKATAESIAKDLRKRYAGIFLAEQVQGGSGANGTFTITAKGFSYAQAVQLVPQFQKQVAGIVPNYNQTDCAGVIQSDGSFFIVTKNVRTLKEAQALVPALQKLAADALLSKRIYHGSQTDPTKFFTVILNLTVKQAVEYVANERKYYPKISKDIVGNWQI
ncbi:phage tail tip lysozyme [Carnobacterium gallinarum]|uniref:phage tail tip lysozyme n=1 Tax=Carnobacterium gallinarum TaxID=2749 RepID=UPI001B806147|nr:phage tail tip lysozyme [Carnobacterium gallinarum]